MQTDTLQPPGASWGRGVACHYWVGVVGTGWPGSWEYRGAARARQIAKPRDGCGPVAARHTVVAGRPVVEDGTLVNPGLEEMLRRHHTVATRLQRLA